MSILANLHIKSDIKLTIDDKKLQELYNCHGSMNPIIIDHRKYYVRSIYLNCERSGSIIVDVDLEDTMENIK